MRHKLYLLSLAILALAGLDASAADTNARDFFGAPDGTTLGILYVPVVRAVSNLRVNALAYRHVWFTNACGTLCTPQFVVPVSDTHVRLPGAAALAASTRMPSTRSRACRRTARRTAP